MAQKIKRKIKHSLPGLLIIILVCSLVVGFSFNVNFDLEYFIARAQNSDTATTQVQVQNAAPTFTEDPLEVPVSTSTSPINYGSGISFNARASDPENNSYRLLICSTNSVIASSVMPTCGVTNYCTSAWASSTNQASCTYSNVQLAAETIDWYAFVCDNHATEADCSPANQHLDDPDGGGSPFYVNHEPTFTAVNTTDNDKDPGGTFIITATASDNDTVAGTDDLLTIYVCGTNSFATTTGCASGQELCHATSTATDNPSCSYVDVAPTPHGQSANYFAFIMDQHLMPSSGNSQQSHYDVNNVRPTVSNVIINSNQGTNITLTMKNQDGTVVYASSTSVGDNNGCTDLVGATSTIYMSTVSDGPNCDDDPNDCYIATTTCVLTDCSGANDAQATYTCSSTLAYHTMSTDVSGGFNPRAVSDWLARLTVRDEALATSSITVTGKDVNTLTAIDVTEATIGYGVVKATFNTGTSTATTTIVNFGNGPLDSIMSGTWMSNGPNAIVESMQKFGSSTFIYLTGGYALSSTTPANAILDIPRPTSQTNVYDEVYWGIGIPGGTPSGTYSGTNTFQASLRGLGNWN